MADKQDINQIITELQKLPTGAITDGISRAHIPGGWLAGLTPRVMGKDTVSYVGRVQTMQYAPRQGRGGKALNPYEIIRERDDQTILLIAAARPEWCVIGDNTVRAAQIAGWEAILIDGSMRDLKAIEEIGLGMFTVGVEGSSSDATELIAYNVPFMFRGHWVQPGDVVAADADGATFFPADRAAEVLHHAQVIDELEGKQDEVIRRQGPMEELKAILHTKHHID